MMDNNNWRPTPPGGVGGGGTEAALDGGDWRAQLPSESRERIVNKIMETLKRHLPVSGPEGLQELKKIAVRFEEKIFTAATSQSDYLRKISLKMLTMETKSQSTIPNALPSNSAGNSSKDSVMQSQIQSQGQPIPNSLAVNQPQTRQQLVVQNIPNNVPSGGQASAGLSSTLSSASGLSQSSLPNTIGQNSMQNMPNVPQNSLSNSMGQGLNGNMFVNPQRQIQARQQMVSQQQQQQSQNPQQYLYPQHYHQHLMKQKLQQGNMPHSLVSSQFQQQQQPQTMLQPTQLQVPQQSVLQTSSVMQPPSMQPAPLTGLQQNQQSSVPQSTQSMLQQHPGLRQQQPQQAVHQQQASLSQQPMLASQQQQQHQLSSQQMMQQNQLAGQQNNMGDMQQQQQQQQQQRLLNQQNNLQNLQQQQQQQQQQLMPQQNNLTNIHPQQMAPQTNVSGLNQQQQLVGSQSGNSSMQVGQHPVHVLQQPKVPIQQQLQGGTSNLLASQGQQSQAQPMQQQLMSQIQQQPAQLQQQVGLQQQANLLQRDMHQRLQASGSLVQQQNVIDQQKQLYPSQRPLSETSTMSIDSVTQTGHSAGGDWQEEAYQKMKSMREQYFPELNDMYQKITMKLQQHESLPQQPKSEQIDRLKSFRLMLEHLITILQVNKNDIEPSFKEKLVLYEKQIKNFRNLSRPKKVPMQQGQLPPPHMQSMQQQQQQQQQSQPQIAQVQSHENQMNPQLQSMNLQGSVASMQQNNMGNLHLNSMSSLSGVSNAQQTMINSLQPNSNMDSGQGNALSSMQQVGMGSMQQNPVSAPQQVNMGTMPQQGGVNMLQSNVNNTHQSNANMLQHQHLKQQQEQQMLQTQQQFKQQYQQRLQQQQQLKQQLLQQQQQQQHQQQLHQAKQQVPSQLQTHQMPQLHQMNDGSDMKIRPGMGVKQGVFQQHHSATHRSSFAHQQLKPATSFPTSSPQLLPAASPQIPQNSSPQIDQQNLLSTLTKAGTPLQSANSPFVVPSPATPLAPSPMPGESEKPVSGVSSLSNAGNIVNQQPSSAPASAPSLAIGTPGISASPLLAEFGPDAAHGNASAIVSSKSTVTEQPIERLIKAVKSMSPQALNAAVNDIGSVVSMVDRIAGSAPGNGSRAAVGEDLVAMTKCRLQARNLPAQDGTSGNRKMRRYTSAMPLNVVSSAGSVNDSFKQFTGAESSDLESTATSSVKRPRIEANHVLLEEIREINQRLIDTVVDISDEDVDPSATVAVAEEGEGVIVKCSFNAVALSPNLKSRYASAQMSPIQPLRLLVPTNYPNCSPVLLDKFPVEVSKEYEDLSVKAKSRFSISLRTLQQPMSLREIARTWDDCARAVILEYAQQRGGGSFSSKYGTWENCLSTA